jgi:hypothetical protein
VRVAGEVRDPGLWSHYVAYMKAALALIGKHEIERREHPNAFWLVVRLFEPLQKLPEFQAFHAHMVSSSLGESAFVDAGGNPIREPESQSHWLMNFYMMPILTAYIGPDLMLDFDECLAKAVYTDLEASLECTQAVYSVVAPLQHFEGPDQEVELDATMALRRLSEDEIQHFWHLGEFGGIVERSQALSMSSCLATCVVTERNAPTNLSEVHGRVWRVVTALRLLKSGQVGVPAVIQRLREPAFGLPGGTVGTSGPSPAALGPSYTLLPEESEPLIAMCRALAKAASAEHLRVPLRRFNYAYERTRPEDRLIDHWVALEALFLPDISQELSFRASLRIAYYVAGTPDEREDVFRKMRLSYDTRSDVVHGQRLKADVSEVASDTEEILRRALRAEVVNPGSLNVERLDAAIARGQGAAQSGGAR